MKVLIVTGGNSSERKISLISTNAVKKALEENRYFVKPFDLKLGFKTLKQILPDFDVVFPVLHGEEGEGGDLQEFLLKQKIPYVGGDPKGFKKGWYKIPFKRFCDQNKIKTAPWKVLSDKGDPSSKTPKDDNLLKIYCQQIVKFGFPSVLKSSNGGSSREVVILKSEHDLKNKACQDLLNSGYDLFVEKYLPGIEVTVGILDNKALPVIEISPPAGGWFDYKNKYSGETQEIIGAPSLSEEIQKEVQKIALNIHQKLNLGPYSRIDFIVSKNIPYVLEVNTIPGLTSESLFPKSAQAAGLSFPNLVKKLVELSFSTAS